VDGLTDQDTSHLQRAREIARRGWGLVHPNPMVGCVLVKEGEVVAEGWHTEWGGAHAEVNALREAEDRAKGATAFVSLEPCNHFGKTPPCSTALLEAGVSRVVYGAADPGLESAGGGTALRAGGIEVVGPVMSLQEARRDNPAFFHNQEHRGTYVAIKLAQTLDGKIAEAPGRRTAITGPEAKVETHRLRAGFDGVLVGSETVRVDDPLLTVREDVPLRKQPARVVLDTEATISSKARLFEDVSVAPVVIFVADDAPEEPVSGLERAGATVNRVPRGKGGLSMEAVLAVCWEMGFRSLFCEGGARLASRLMVAEAAQRLHLFVAPFVLGNEGVPAFPGMEGAEAWSAWAPAATPTMFGKDVLLEFDRID